MRRVLIAPLGVALALTTAGCGWMSGGHRNSQADAGYAGRTHAAANAGYTGGRSNAATMNTANAEGPTNQQVRDAQQKLQQLGLYHGPIDGIYGPQTVAAVHQFQSKNNMPQTGALNDYTQQRLAQAQGGQNQPETAQAPAPGNPANTPSNNEANQPGNQPNSESGAGNGGQNPDQNQNQNENQNQGQ